MEVLLSICKSIRYQFHGRGANCKKCAFSININEIQYNILKLSIFITFSKSMLFYPSKPQAISFIFFQF